MSNLKALQHEFIALLQGHNQAFSDRVKEQSPVTTQIRLDIYKNAYNTRLREAIDNDHPMLGRYLGDELYDQLVSGYLDAYPSTVKSLRHFCQSLPQFLTESAPFSSHPILSELATFERLLLDVFDAKDSLTCTLTDLQQIDVNHWPNIHLAFHPSRQVFAQHTPAVETWQALKSQQTPPSAKQTSTPTHWLLWRNQERLTEFSHLNTPELACFEHFNNGGNFADSCELLSQFYAPENVPLEALTLIQKWLNNGLVVNLSC